MDMENSLHAHGNAATCSTNTENCKCGLACYLTEYGREMWPQIDSSVNRGTKLNQGFYYYPTGCDTLSKSIKSRLRLQNGLLSIDPGIRLTSRSRSTEWIQWVKVNKLLVVVIAMLSLTAVLPFVWFQDITSEEKQNQQRPVIKYAESDQKLGRIVRSLRAVHTDDDSKQQKHLQSINTTISKFLWLVHSNTPPNYFLGERDKFDKEEYKSSPIVFLHHHRAAGTAMATCLKSISRNLNFGSVPNLDSDSRALWDNNVKHRKTDQEAHLHTGQYSFGVCNGYGSHKCSYFMLLRDPIERAVSSYHYCKQMGLRSDQEMCRVVDANDISLRDWILLQGSLTFQQFLYNATWCDEPTPQLGSYSLDGTDVHVAPSKQWPCWLKQRVHLDTLSYADKNNLLEYVLQNLESWFSVIGLTNDMDKSLKMFEKVYSLPFSQCTGLKQQDIGYHDNRSNRKPKDGYYDDNDPNYLKYDYFVRKALDADFKIYKKAQSIYRIQRQMEFNTL